MAYKYETHLHTSTSSACGKSAGPEYLEGYKALGYDGVFVTDHFWKGNTCVNRLLPWRLWAERYCRAYEETKEAGDRLGIKVFFGWEITYGSGEDFLIYGLDKDWLKAHKELLTIDQKTQYELISAAGGLVVQAHPFRERGYMRDVRLHPYCCDAWEVANAGNTQQQDINAKVMADSLGLVQTCGSDIHSVTQLEAGLVYPMLTEEPLNSERDYVRLIKSGKGFSAGCPAERLQGEAMPTEMKAFFYERDGREIKLKSK